MLAWDWSPAVVKSLCISFSLQLERKTMFCTVLPHRLLYAVFLSFALWNVVLHRLDRTSQINRNATWDSLARLTLHFFAYLMRWTMWNVLIFHTYQGLLYTVWAAKRIRVFFFFDSWELEDSSASLGSTGREESMNIAPDQCGFTDQLWASV